MTNDENRMSQFSNDLLSKQLIIKFIGHSRFKRSENYMEGLYKPIENEHPNKRHDSNDEFRPGDSVYSFNSNNVVAKSSTSPLGINDNHTPIQERPESNYNLANSDYGSRSRSRSGYRKISQSPIEVNKSFEISQKNTENLWNDFKENLRDSSVSRQKNPNLSSKTYNPIKREEVKQTLEEQSFQDSNYYTKTTHLIPEHKHRISYNSNVDTNHFIDTSKSEDKNRLMSEKYLKKLIMVSGDINSQPKSALRENISFDRNTQVLAGFRIDSNTNKRSQASQFTFNSTERMQSNGMGKI